MREKKSIQYIRKYEAKEGDKKAGKSVRTKAAIKKAALQCFSESGYSATSIQDIADACKITKPTLYYYFDGKPQLFDTLVREALDASLQITKEKLSQDKPMREMLIDLYEAMVFHTQNNRALARLIQYAFFAANKEIPNRKETYEYSRTLFGIVEEFFMNQIKDGEFQTKFDPQQLTFVIIGTINSTINSMLPDKNVIYSHEDAVNFVDIFLKGAKAN